MLSHRHAPIQRWCDCFVSRQNEVMALGQLDLELLSFLLTAVRKLFSITPVLLTLLDPGCPQTFSTGYFHLVQEAEQASGSLALRQKLLKLASSISCTHTSISPPLYVYVFRRPWCEIQSIAAAPSGHCAFDLARNYFPMCRMIS